MSIQPQSPEPLIAIDPNKAERSLLAASSRPPEQGSRIMKASIAIGCGALLLVVAGAVSAQDTVEVRGHYNANGTYVAPHMQTAPNQTKTDNWSSKPNTNPYTGKAGTVDPYKPTPPKQTGW